MARTSCLFPAATLALITPFLTELLSGSTPVPLFFLPWTFVPLVLIYGLPVLLIRDLFVRWKLSLPGLFVLGLAYGVYNEGVVAKTLPRSENVPIGIFNHYTFLGLNWPWSFLIVPWHALLAVIFPIAIVSWLFPTVRQSAWLSQSGFTIASLVVIALGAFLHFHTPGFRGSPFYLLIFYGVILALVLLSGYLPRGSAFLVPEDIVTWHPALAGFIFYPVFVLGLCIPAGLKLPGSIICLISVLLLGAWYRLVRSRNWLTRTSCVLFALGDYLFVALFHLVIAIKQVSVVTMGAMLVMSLIFSYGLVHILRKPKAP